MMPEAEAAPRRPRRWRRFFQVHLRTLLALHLLFCGALATWWLWDYYAFSVHVLEVGPLPPPPNWPAFSPDGRLLAAIDDWERVRLWSARSGQLLRQGILERPAGFPYTEAGRPGVSFGADGRRLEITYRNSESDEQVTISQPLADIRPDPERELSANEKNRRSQLSMGLWWLTRPAVDPPPAERWIRYGNQSVPVADIAELPKWVRSRLTQREMRWPYLLEFSPDHSLALTVHDDQRFRVWNLWPDYRPAKAAAAGTLLLLLVLLRLTRRRREDRSLPVAARPD